MFVWVVCCSFFLGGGVWGFSRGGETGMLLWGGGDGGLFFQQDQSLLVSHWVFLIRLFLIPIKLLIEKLLLLLLSTLFLFQAITNKC